MRSLSPAQRSGRVSHGTAALKQHPVGPFVLLQGFSHSLVVLDRITVPHDACVFAARKDRGADEGGFAVAVLETARSQCESLSRSGPGTSGSPRVGEIDQRAN